MTTGQPDPDADAGIRRLLASYAAGDDAALHELIPLVYDDLRAIAHRQRSGWDAGGTLGTTALAHEAFMKISASAGASYVSRSHFLAVASRAMGQILIDDARSKRAEKRGGSVKHVPLERVAEILHTFPEMSDGESAVLVRLGDCLARLRAESPRHCLILECRVFGGMTIEETATALRISPATVKRGWSVAQAWLRRELQGGTNQDAADGNSAL